jgi:hypothetical protein
MKQPAFLFLLVICCGLVFAGVIRVVQSRRIKVANDRGLTIADTPRDIGSVLVGSPIQTSFILNNNSSGPISISKIQPSCGCASVDLSKRTLVPGDTAILHVVLKAGTREQTRVITIAITWSHDNGKPEALISMAKLSVKDYSVLNLEPENLEIEFSTTEAASQKVEVLVRKGHYPVKWDGLDVQASNHAIRVSVAPENKQVFLVSLETNCADWPIGENEARVKIVPTFRGKAICGPTEVPVFVQVDSKIELQPSSIYFGVIKEGNEESATLRLNVPPGMDISHVEVHSDDNDEMRVRASETAGIWNIAVELISRKLGSGRADIDVSVHGDKDYKFSVPVIWLCSANS